eukprot:354671-Rhodomonas_salina.1
MDTPIPGTRYPRASNPAEGPEIQSAGTRIPGYPGTSSGTGGTLVLKRNWSSVPGVPGATLNKYVSLKYFKAHASLEKKSVPDLGRSAGDFEATSRFFGPSCVQTSSFINSILPHAGSMMIIPEVTHLA